MAKYYILLLFALTVLAVYAFPLLNTITCTVMVLGCIPTGILLSKILHKH